ncbi:hypothetical protein KTO58_05555 [Chitinophaga pendula]|uniref:hypothetical protein n=1 Tax=Chitinophaga TaxID=79328 RepID=UPI000BAF3C42|nr:MULTISPECIES: hypothetical protein [Chitinophaga]ASZ13728.1 hypothetical protein CK934_23615 [Chitinophaga sp. MD30]UCJ08653.1 hypothetical protein KTO58_05555 [Chitinophaga pendula]
MNTPHNEQKRSFAEMGKIINPLINNSTVPAKPGNWKLLGIRAIPDKSINGSPCTGIQEHNDKAGGEVVGDSIAMDHPVFSYTHRKLMSSPKKERPQKKRYKNDPKSRNKNLISELQNTVEFMLLNIRCEVIEQFKWKVPKYHQMQSTPSILTKAQNEAIYLVVQSNLKKMNVRMAAILKATKIRISKERL